jgi:hypothetical protein
MSDEKPKTLVDKIIDMDERYIYAAVFIILAIPLLRPLGLPLLVSEQPRRTYEYIENMEPGSIVVYGYDASAITYMDQGPGAKAVLRHLMRTPGIRIVGLTISTEGEMFWNQDIDNVGPHDKKYGEDYVWLGFIPGTETGLAAALDNPELAYGGTDAYGTPFSEIPLLQDFISGDDADLFIEMCAGGAGFFAWLRQASDTYSKPFIAVPLGAEAGSYISFLRTGQVYSWVAGTRQAAEYQILLGEPGPIVATMDAQSIAHIFAMLLIVVGNIMYFVQKSSTKDGQ